MALKGRCHCGATQFEVTEAPSELTARDRVSTYQFGHYAGAHHHCGVCGCGTYSEFPDFSSGQPDFANSRLLVNRRLFDVEAFDIEVIPVKRVNGRTDW